MAKQVQFRRGTTSQHSSFTGAVGEITVDTDKDTVVVHDGSTAGGFPLVRQLSDLSLTASSTELNYVDGVTSAIQTQLNAKLSDLVSDTSPQLGGNLDINGQDIVTTSNADLDLAPNGTGKVVVKGNDNSGKIVLNCENNSHGVTLAGPAHSASATYEVALPNTLGTSNNSSVLTSDANGDVNLSEELKAKSYNETYAAVTSSSNATTVDCHNGNAFSHTLTENTTFTFSNPPASGTAFSFSLEIIQDASASGYTVTWPSSVDYPSATAPTLTATASAKDLFIFYTRDGGTNWLGFTAGQALG